MKNEYCYVYCKGILGVKTNIRHFKWIYGSDAPSVSFEEYEKCILKFNIYVQSEKELDNVVSYDQKFQSYVWNDDSNTMFYRRALPLNLKIGYNIRFIENTVEMHVGKRYLKLIKYRMMNLHGIYYLLSDIANMMLLKNGFLTLYASAVFFAPQKRGIVCFAPPNTGKTITATKLCELPDYSMVGEDVIITDGKQLFACPWTSSYRKRTATSDSAGSFGRIHRPNIGEFCETCELTDFVVLSLGEKKIEDDKNELLRRVCILNGYLFNYYSSPIIKVLAYFSEEYCKSWNECAKEILKKITDINNCRGLQSPQALDFWELVHCAVLGENL